MLNFMLSSTYGVVLYIAIALCTCCGIAAVMSRKDARVNLWPAERQALPITFIDRTVLVSLLFAFIVAWAWVVFFPLDFGHRDEIALLTEKQPPQIFAGRFFPLGHLEFNILSWKFFNGQLGPLYMLPLIQIFLYALLIERIVHPSRLIFKVYALGLSLWLAAMVPLVNLIVPERNAILLILAGLYFIKKYNSTPNAVTAFAAVFFCGLSLYYKEPIFAFLLVFASIMVLYKLAEIRRINGAGDKIINYLKAFGPIEIGLALASVLFLIGYYIFVFYRGGPDSFYLGVSSSVSGGDYLKRFSPYVFDIPILSTLMFTAAGAHFFIKDHAFDRAFAVGIALGGAVYLAAMVVLGMYLNGYYYSIPLLAMVLSSAILLKNVFPLATLTHQRALWGKAASYMFACLLIVLVGTTAFKQSTPIAADLIQKKNYQTEYAFLRKALQNQREIKSVYYAPITGNYNDYTTAILMIFMHKADISHEFDIYSSSGCSIFNQKYNGGLITCSAKEFSSNDAYDVIVMENDSLPEIDLSQYDISKHNDLFQRYTHPLNNISVAVRKN